MRQCDIVINIFVLLASYAVVNDRKYNRCHSHSFYGSKWKKDFPYQNSQSNAVYAAKYPTKCSLTRKKSKKPSFVAIVLLMRLKSDNTSWNINNFAIVGCFESIICFHTMKKYSKPNFWRKFTRTQTKINAK